LRLGKAQSQQTCVRYAKRTLEQPRVLAILHHVNLNA
jgi:hypothetical protein